MLISLLLGEYGTLSRRNQLFFTSSLFRRKEHHSFGHPFSSF